MDVNTRTWMLLSNVRQESYGLEKTELMSAGAIKYQLSKYDRAVALDKLNDPAGILTELSETITKEELDTGKEILKLYALEFLKTIKPDEIMKNSSVQFQKFIKDCRDALK